MRPGRAVAYALGHRVRFMPHYVRPEPPAVRLQREGYQPGDPHDVFGLDAGSPAAVRPIDSHVSVTELGVLTAGAS